MNRGPSVVAAECERCGWSVPHAGHLAYCRGCRKYCCSDCAYRGPPTRCISCENRKREDDNGT